MSSFLEQLLASMHTQRLPLLDVPCAWLAQLVSTHLPASSLCAVFQTCKKLQGVVQQHAPKSHTLRLDLHSMSLQHAGTALQIASNGRSWSLDAYWGDWASVTSRLSSAGWSLLFSLLASYTDQLTRLTTVKLWGLNLPHILPPELDHCCPALANLVLRECTIEWDSATADSSFKGSFPNLASLQLSNTHSRQNIQPAQEQQLTQQLGQLTSLRALQLQCEGRPGTHVDMQMHIVIVNAVPARQLTQLSVGVDLLICDYEPNLPEPDSYNIYLDWHQMSWLQPERAPHLTALQRLELRLTTVTDRLMSVLLGLPQLQVLVVDSFDLATSFAQEPCQWQQVTVAGSREENVGMEVEQLGLLPLSNPELQLTIKCPDLWLGTDLAVLSEAVRNASKCKGVVWAVKAVAVGGDWFDIDHGTAQKLLKQVLPLLARSTGMYIRCCTLDEDTVTHLCTHVSANPSRGLYLELDAPSAELAAHLLPLMACLPFFAQLTIDCRDESAITQLCCAAQRPMFMTIKYRQPLQPGWKGRVQAAMQLSGHQHVYLDVMW